MRLMKRLVVCASAKVNLCLRVLGRRSDGYHEVQTVLHTVGIWDRLHLSPLPGERRIALTVNVPEVPADESNLCWRAAHLLAERAKTTHGVKIDLEKSIPAGAGLGGGSSDAAATLAGLSRLWELDIDPEELDDLGAELGADVPFFRRGGCSLARGKGEKLEDLPAVDAWLVVVVPERRVPTPQAYAALARGATRGRRRALTRAIQRVMNASSEGDLHALAAALHNDFEALEMAGIAEAREAKSALLQAGCLGALLSGSGSGVFGIAPDRDAAESIAAQLRGRWSWVVAAPTLPAGRSLLIRDAAER
jgi:4-diphosphocytidyl-2-C-methyl-D-erythritol kinase